jgi:predicted HNH restriction endonuclease
MTVKDDFMSLFGGHEAEIASLTERFPIRDFTYMETSQRTIAKIYIKLTQIIENQVPPIVHQNFWSDLRMMGLVKQNPNRISDFGKVVYEYFKNEKDSFKREYFILSNIKKRSYDIEINVQQLYQEKVRELEDCLSIIPALNQLGSELLNNPEKILITGFLNVFPYALRRYYNLPLDRQHAIDSLHESGCNELFDQTNVNESPYFNIAKRLRNNWRAHDRRINFVKSVILSKYEDLVEDSNSSQIDFSIDPTFEKILNNIILNSILAKSDKIQVEGDGEERIINRKLRDIIKTVIIDDFTDNQEKRERREIQRVRIETPEQRRSRIENKNREAREGRSSKPRKVYAEQYQTDQNISATVKEEANHLCQSCRQPTFETTSGHNYTEGHHLISVRKNGDDAPYNIAVLCPLCHRKIHHGIDEIKLMIYQNLRNNGVILNLDFLLENGIISQHIYDSLNVL